MAVGIAAHRPALRRRPSPSPPAQIRSLWRRCRYIVKTASRKVVRACHRCRSIPPCPRLNVASRKPRPPAELRWRSLHASSARPGYERLRVRSARYPGTIRIMNASPGAAKARAPSQCHPQTFMAPKKAPIVTGKVNRNRKAATSAATAQKAGALASRCAVRVRELAAFVERACGLLREPFSPGEPTCSPRRSYSPQSPRRDSLN